MMPVWSVPVPAICNVYRTSPDDLPWVRYLLLSETNHVETVTTLHIPDKVVQYFEMDIEIRH